MNLLLNLVVRGISHIWVGNLYKYITHKFYCQALVPIPIPIPFQPNPNPKPEAVPKSKGPTSSSSLKCQALPLK